MDFFLKEIPLDLYNLYLVLNSITLIKAVASYQLSQSVY